MPELDFAVVCDYVRTDGGVAHVLGGGFDTLTVQEVPTGRNIGVWARILLARNECDRDHRLELLIQDIDGERVAEVSGVFRGEWPQDFPPAWKVGVGFALNLGLPIPRIGEYSVEILINDSLAKTIPLRVVQAA